MPLLDKEKKEFDIFIGEINLSSLHVVDYEKLYDLVIKNKESDAIEDDINTYLKEKGIEESTANDITYVYYHCKNFLKYISDT